MADAERKARPTDMVWVTHKDHKGGDGKPLKRRMVRSAFEKVWKAKDWEEVTGEAASVTGSGATKVDTKTK